MPEQWMPGMGTGEMGNMDNMGNMNPMDNMGNMNPMGNMNSMCNMTPMGMWTMPWWDQSMWNPDMEEDPQEMRDREYWMQLYPEQTRRVQREVEHQCDLLDYEGSVMYDEYPDRIALARICEAVYNALMQGGRMDGSSGGMMGNQSGNMSGNLAGRISRDMARGRSQEFMEEDDGMMDEITPEEEQEGARNYQPIGPVDMMQMGRQDRSLQNLIEALLFHEMHRRRRRRRRNRNWYFG